MLHPLHASVRRVASHVACCAGALVLAGCDTPPAAPLDPALILEELRDIDVDAPNDGLTADEAAAIALAFNPEIRAARSRIGVAQADAVLAGLFPDPTIGVDLSELGVLVGDSDGDGDTDGVDVASDPLDWVAGVDLTIPLPRPGERDALRRGAAARSQQARFEAARAEWRLAGDVRQAFVEALAADARIALAEELVGVARGAHDVLLAAREAGAATALEETLAGLDVERLGQRHASLQVERDIARARLNALLGLPPATVLRLATQTGPFATAAGAPDPGDAQAHVDAAVEQAVARRPDLSILLAAYEAAEQDLQLAVARRWPSLVVGTALALELPLFSRFNGPAIDAALARRDQLRDEARAAVHAVRAEVHAAFAEHERARGEGVYFRRHVEPRLRRALELTEDAVRVREAGRLELAAARQRLLDALQQSMELRVAEARSREALRTATAADLPPREPIAADARSDEARP